MTRHLFAADPDHLPQAIHHLHATGTPGAAEPTVAWGDCFTCSPSALANDITVNYPKPGVRSRAEAATRTMALSRGRERKRAPPHGDARLSTQKFLT